MSHLCQNTTKLHSFQSGFCWVFVFYVYLTMFPSKSVYLNYIPHFRNIVLIFLDLMFIVYLQKYSLSKIKGIIPFVIIFVVSNFLSFLTNSQLLSGDIVYFIHVNLIVVFCLLKLPVQSVIYKRFVKVGAFLIILGLTEYIIRMLTGLDIYLATNMDRGEESFIVYDHGLFNIYPQELIPRFQGLFREPGMLGICAGLLLFNSHNLNKTHFIIWAAGGFFALSLTYYALVLLALVYHLFVTRLLFNIKSVIILCLLFVCGIIMAMPILDKAILDRVELYSEEGDNRTDKQLNDELNTLIHGNDIWWGYGNERFQKRDYAWGNAGFKAELYKYGVVLIVLFIGGFGLLLFSYPIEKLNKIVVFFLYLVVFYVVDCKYAIHIYIILLSMFNPYVKKGITYNRSTIVKFGR